VPGAVVMLIALVLFPVVAIIGSAGIAALLGFLLNRDAEQRHEGSELLDVNV